MSIHDDAEAARRQVYDDRLNGLGDQIAALSNDNTRLETELEVAHRDVEQLSRQVTDLQQALEDCRNNQPGPGPDPEPPSTGVKLGAGVNGPLFKTLGYTHADATRVFLRQIGAADVFPKIANDSSATQDLRDGISNLATGGVLWLSWKEEDVAILKHFFSGPDWEAVKKIYTVYGTYRHEPENDSDVGANNTAGQKIYRDNWKKQSTMIRAAGMVPALCLMRYTLQKASGRDWKWWYPGDGVVDITGWDCYRKGPAGENDMAAMANMAKDMEAAAAESNTKWALGETGSTSERYTEADTAQWAANWRKYLLGRSDVGAVCWYDARAFTLTKKVAEAWMGRPAP